MSDHPNGYSGEQAAAIKRFFGALPVMEGKINLPVFVTEKQAREGKPGNPRECSVALGCQSLYGSTAVLIFRSIAYVDILDPETKKRAVWRMTVPRKTLDYAIKPKDSGGKSTSGLYWLIAPTPGLTLDHRQARRDAIRQGEIVPEKRPGVRHPKKPKGVVGTPGFLRDGVGMVQMTRRSARHDAA